MIPVEVTQTPWHFSAAAYEARTASTRSFGNI
jgi:hypothetical protein